LLQLPALRVDVPRDKAAMNASATSGIPASRMTVRMSSAMPAFSAIRFRLAALVKGGR